MNAIKPILKAGDLAPSELLQLLEELEPPSGEPIRCWLDAPDGWAFDFWPGAGGTVLWNGAGRSPRNEAMKDVVARVRAGRVFAPSGELKWRLLPALGEHCCRVVFLGSGWSSAQLERLPLRNELTALTPEKTIYPVWGQQTPQTPGEWIDLRIPHRLRYPVKVETPVRGRVIARVIVEIWKDACAEPQFVRLCDLDSQWEA